MATVPENLEKILQARYGEEVRGAIHDSIEDIYEYANGDAVEALTSNMSNGTILYTNADLTITGFINKDGTINPSVDVYHTSEIIDCTSYDYIELNDVAHNVGLSIAFYSKGWLSIDEETYNNTSDATRKRMYKINGKTYYSFLKYYFLTGWSSGTDVPTKKIEVPTGASVMRLSNADANNLICSCHYKENLIGVIDSSKWRKVDVIPSLPNGQYINAWENNQGLKSSKIKYRIGSYYPLNNASVFLTTKLYMLNPTSTSLYVKGIANIDGEGQVDCLGIAFYSAPFISASTFVHSYRWNDIYGILGQGSEGSNNGVIRDYAYVTIPDGASYVAFSGKFDLLSDLRIREDDIVGESIMEYSDRSPNISEELMRNSGTKIALVGDSITQGQGSTGFVIYQDGDANVRGNGPNYPEKDDDYQVGEYLGSDGGRTWYEAIDGNGWAQKLKSYLESLPSNVIVKNYGMSGINVNDLGTYLIPDKVKSFNVVIIMIGTNNRTASAFDYYNYTHHLTINVSKLLKLGIKVILMSEPPASDDNEKRYGGHINDVQNAAAYVAKDSGVPYINMYQEVLDYCTYTKTPISDILSDGLHPNDTGYDIMFRIVCKHLGIAAKSGNY